jgi:hypothetical protein
MITRGLQYALSLHIFLSFILESNPTDVNYHQRVFVIADQTHYIVLSFFSIKLIELIYSVCLERTIGTSFINRLFKYEQYNN